MRRDICYYYRADVQTVYDGFYRAICKDFDKSPSINPPFTIGVDLKFSFRYNMNGGACTVRFMPSNGGTLVNLRYSIAQLMGARYGAHAEAIEKAVYQTINLRGESTSVDAEIFVRYEKEQMLKQSGQCAPAQPAQHVANAPTGTCTKCGMQYSSGQKFCVNCGEKIQQKAEKFCTSCGKKIAAESKFCCECGAKQ